MARFNFIRNVKRHPRSQLPPPSLFPSEGMPCSWCRKPGHTITACTADGTESERERRKNDPKEIEKREKARKKKEKANEGELKRLQVTSQKKMLRQVNVEPGILQQEFEAACETIKGALETVLTSDYLKNILEIMNENRFVEI